MSQTFPALAMQVSIRMERHFRSGRPQDPTACSSLSSSPNTLPFTELALTWHMASEVSGVKQNLTPGWRLSSDAQLVWLGPLEYCPVEEENFKFYSTIINIILTNAMQQIVWAHEIWP